MNKIISKMPMRTVIAGLVFSTSVLALSCSSFAQSTDKSKDQEQDKDPMTQFMDDLKSERAYIPDTEFPGKKVVKPPRNPAARDMRADPAAIQQLRQQKNDKKLKRLIENYKDNFFKNEASYKERLERTNKAINKNANFSDDRKVRLRELAQEKYRRDSTRNVKIFRRPLNARLIKLANAAIPDTTKHITMGIGKDIWIIDKNIPKFKTDSQGNQVRDQNGQLILNDRYKRDKKGRRIDNKDYSGAGSDIDTQGSVEALRKQYAIAKAHGLNPTMVGNVVDIPILEHTTNVVSGKGVLQDPNNKIGSSARDAGLLADARDKERFLFVEMDKGAKRDFVEMQDHVAKTVKLRRTPPSNVFKTGKDGKPSVNLQTGAKSTYKMLTDSPPNIRLSDAEIDVILKKNGLNSTPADFRNSLEKIYGREKLTNIDTLEPNKPGQFRDAISDVQNAMVGKADTHKNAAIQRDQSHIDKLNQEYKAEIEKDTPDSKKVKALAEAITTKKSKLIDEKSRVSAVTQANADALSGRAPSKMIVIPPKKTLRQKIAAANKKIPSYNKIKNLPTGNRTVLAGSRKFTKGMGWASDYRTVLEVGGAIYKGDTDKLWDIAGNETKSFVGFKVLERIVPGAGELIMAYDVGYTAGTYIGYIPIGSDGKNIHQHVEEAAGSFYDSYYGHGKKNAEQERENAYRAYLKELIADNEMDGLPDGMTSVEAYNIGLESAQNGGDFFTTIDELSWKAFDQKDAIRQAESDALAKLIEANRKKIIRQDAEKAAALKAQEEADRLQREENIQLAAAEKLKNESGDDWDDIDEVDNLVVSNVSDEQKWVIRDQMAAQQEADRAKSDNQANQSFAVIEQQREEEARRKEQARREFAAGLQALAQGLGQVAQGIQEAERQSAIAAQENRDQVNSAMEDYQQKIQSSGSNKSCVNDLMSRRNFPITDPYLARSMCGKSSQSQYKPPSDKPEKYKIRYTPQVYKGIKIDRGNQTCAQKSAGSKNPKRWTACCNSNGEMRYNAFSAPNGRVGMSAYRCMMPGKPDEGKYMIRID